MQPENNYPIEYAEKIVELLANTSYPIAEIALKIAGNLLEYRLRGEMSNVLAVEQPDAEVGI